MQVIWVEGDDNKTTRGRVVVSLGNHADGSCASCCKGEICHVVDGKEGVVEVQTDLIHRLGVQ